MFDCIYFKLKKKLENIITKILHDLRTLVHVKPYLFMYFRLGKIFQNDLDYFSSCIFFSLYIIQLLFILDYYFSFILRVVEIIIFKENKLTTVNKRK